MEPPSGFEHGTPGLGIQRLNQWFNDNHMKANENKCDVLLSPNKNVPVNIGTTRIQNSSKKLLGIKIDSKINFKDHLGSTCKRPLPN